MALPTMAEAQTLLEEGYQRRQRLKHAAEQELAPKIRQCLDQEVIHGLREGDQIIYVQMPVQSRHGFDVHKYGIEYLAKGGYKAELVSHMKEGWNVGRLCLAVTLPSRK